MASILSRPWCVKIFLKKLATVLYIHHNLLCLDKQGTPSIF